MHTLSLSDWVDARGAPTQGGQQAVQVGMPVELVAVRSDGEDGRGQAGTLPVKQA